MKVVLVADVGGSDGYHVGDEAMLDEAIRQLRLRGDVDITVISGDPVDTAERYSVCAVPRIGFAAGDDARPAEQRARQLGAVQALRGTEPWNHPTAHCSTEPCDAGSALIAVDKAIAESDAVVIAGGGNLCSTWPEHIYERVGVLSLARHHGVATAVTGQTIGPELSEAESTLLCDALGDVRLVGLRETSSLQMAATVLRESVPRRLQLDDAVALPDAVVRSFDGDSHLRDGYIGLTVNPLRGPDAAVQLDGIAQLVHHMHDRTGLRVLFLPHVGHWTGPASGDVEVAQALQERVGDRSELLVCPLLPARQVASLSRGASAIVSTRYHPIVFGLSAAVPCLALYQDRYTLTKLSGALAHAGLGQWRIPTKAVTSAVACTAFDEVWSRRKELTQHLQETSHDWPSMHRAHWDEMWRAITEPRSTLGAAPFSPVVPREVEPTSISLGLMHPDSQAAATDTTESPWQAQFKEAERYALDLEATLAVRAQETEALRTHLAFVEQDRNTAAEALAVASVQVDYLHTQVAEAELRRAGAEADSIELLDATRHAEDAASVARALVAQLSEHLDTAAAALSANTTQLADAAVQATEMAALSSDLMTLVNAQKSTIDEQGALIEEIYATRTMRWTHRPRTVYFHLRRLAHLRGRGVVGRGQGLPPGGHREASDAQR